MDSKSILLRNAFISSCPFDRSYYPCTCIYTVYLEFVHAWFITRVTRYLKYRCDPYRKYGSLSVVKFISNFCSLTQCTSTTIITYTNTLTRTLTSYTYYWQATLTTTEDKCCSRPCTLGACVLVY